MLQRPLATILMVTYNSERFIKDAIESILCQSYEYFELVICDDASGDSTWDIIKQYTDSRIRAYRNEFNIGEYPNRNKAINYAKGEYLIFIDGDDMMYPHGLEFMVKMLHNFPECGMALMRWFKNNLLYPLVITPHQLYTGIYFGYGFNDIAFANVLFRTSVLRDVGGLTEKYKAGDDYVRLNIGARYPSLLISDGLTWWRETPGQASSLLNNSIEGLITEYKIKYQFLCSANCPLTQLEIKEAKANLDNRIAKYLIKQLIKIKWKNVRMVMEGCNFSFLQLSSAFSEVIKKDPFEGYSPANPLKLDWDRNPYAKTSISIHE